MRQGETHPPPSSFHDLVDVGLVKSLLSATCWLVPTQPLPLRGDCG